jgi:hypothetical protein
MRASAARVVIRPSTVSNSMRVKALTRDIGSDTVGGETGLLIV